MRDRKEKGRLGILGASILAAIFIFWAGIVRYGLFSKGAKTLGITSGSEATDNLFGIGAVYLLIFAVNAFSAKASGNLSFKALFDGILKGFSEGFFKRTLPVALALFLPTYALFYFVFSGVLPYPETSLALIPLFFLIRFSICSVEEGFFRGVLQESFGKGSRGILMSALAFGAYFALSTKFLPVAPNFFLGFAVGAASGYLHEKSGGFGASALARAIYETLILAVLV